MFADTDIAWAAGIVDGEGTIGAYTNGKSGGLVLSLGVGNTDFRMVAKLHNMFGGNLRESNPCASGKAYWSWKVTSRVAESAIRQILPYLITKREQADVALVFSGTVERPARQELAIKLREMKKGVTV